MTQVKGISNLVKKLNKLGGEGKDIVRKSLAKNINIVKDQAVLLCPGNGDGDLAKSINVKVEETSKGVQASCYTNMEYAAYVEFGTGPVGEANHSGISPKVNVSYRSDGWTYMDEKTGDFIHTKGQPARPYLYPALKNNEKNIANGVKGDIKLQIRKECSK